ncbi:MAG: class I SAM-dependent methyltransferase [Bacteroidetes bacterium]|nr:class I SAM-dependent methyltransferase [Bacteroidota bacterium]
MKFKEIDIRPSDLMKLKEPALEHDKQFLLARKDEFIKVNCPACCSDDHSKWAIKDNFDYTICNQCNTVFMNPRANELLLADFYKQSKNYEFWNKYIFPASDEIRKERIFKPRAQKVIDFCTKHQINGTILEVGAAYGTFCEAIKGFNYFQRIIAVEPTPDLAETCRKKDLEVFQEPIENVKLPNESIDVVVSFEVIEHLFNPKDFIINCTSMLKKGGLFICTCPSIDGLGTLVLKEKAKVIDHEHLNYFSPSSLALLFQDCCLEILEVSTPGELDVDLLKNAFIENPEDFSDQQFISKILSSEEEKIRNNFQDFLKKNLLSSHLWIIGRKK